MKSKGFTLVEQALPAKDWRNVNRIKCKELFAFASGGFTLVELLLVITIISVLAAVVVPRFFGRSQEARITAARQTIVGTLGIAMDMFEQDVGRYPTSEEGLEGLVRDVGVVGWRGPYLKSDRLPLDPWGNDYFYSWPSELTGSEMLYDIVSSGPDGVRGNEDDITNHSLQSKL